MCLYEDWCVSKRNKNTTEPMPCQSTVKSHQNLAKSFCQPEFHNSYSKLGKREVSYDQVPRFLHATSCFVMYPTQKIKHVPSQSTERKAVTHLLIYSKDTNIFIYLTKWGYLLNEHKPDHPDVLPGNRGHGSFP